MNEKKKTTYKIIATANSISFLDVFMCIVVVCIELIISISRLFFFNNLRLVRHETKTNEKKCTKTAIVLVLVHCGINKAIASKNIYLFL